MKITYTAEVGDDVAVEDGIVMHIDFLSQDGLNAILTDRRWIKLKDMYPVLGQGAWVHWRIKGVP